jgi:hypothetical protein
MARGNGEGRVELVQVPAQPLLRPAAFVDEIVAVIDQQLQLPKRLLVRQLLAAAESATAVSECLCTSQPTRQLAAILERPQPLLVELRRPGQQLVICRRDSLLVQAGAAEADGAGTARRPSARQVGSDRRARCRPRRAA